MLAKHLICAYPQVEWKLAKIDMNLPWPNISYPNTTTQQCDVILIGATLPSLWLAVEIAKHGFSVSILENRSHIAQAQELRQLGMIQTGLLDNHWRIAQGLGEHVAQEIYRSCNRGVSIIKSLTPTRAKGWMLSRDKREEEELHKLHTLYQKWGVQTSIIPSHILKDLFSAQHIRTGIQLPNEGCINPTQLTDTLCEKMREASIPLCCSADIQSIENHNGGVRVRHQHGTTDAEILIYMQHDRLQKIEPFFSSTLHSVRMQSIAYTRTTPFIPHSCTAQYGYINWRDEGNIRFLSGCRWATPHLEQGESDDSVTVLSIEEALIRTAKQCFSEENINILHRWSMIERKSCDGLPLVGPLPGRDHIIACTAFHGRLLGLGFACAESIKDLLMHGRTLTLPSCFSTRRFIV